MAIEVTQQYLCIGLYAHATSTITFIQHVTIMTECLLSENPH